MIPLVVIEGPTASGKTQLALQLARELGSQIISADSRQVYRYMDIGTAKPTQAELESVPHHLISIIDPDQSYNAGRFYADACQVIGNLQAQGSIPIICGGTGLYVSALLNGIFELDQLDSQIREALLQRLQNEDLEVLYSELKELDPDFAQKISSRDKQRILRGLEVYQMTGIPISRHWQQQRSVQRFKVFRILIDLPRELLYSRINQRIVEMMRQGLLDEIQKLLDLGYSENSPGLTSLGYREFMAHLKGNSSLEECIILAAQHSRNYAKRQCTWYRKRKFDLTLGQEDLIISGVLELIQSQLGKINTQ